MTKPDRPSCQDDDCPPWCEGGHAETDHPDDRVHRSAGTLVPVIARRAVIAGAHLRHLVEATEIEIGMSRAVGELEVWVSISAGDAQGIELSLDSAIRVQSSRWYLLTTRHLQRGAGDRFATIQCHSSGALSSRMGR